MEKLTIYYHTSTHWDREWYLPFQGFRYNLVKMIDVYTIEGNWDIQCQTSCRPIGGYQILGYGVPKY